MFLSVFVCFRYSRCVCEGVLVVTVLVIECLVCSGCLSGWFWFE